MRPSFSPVSLALLGEREAIVPPLAQSVLNEAFF